MAKKLYSDTSVQAIANAIRSKNQTQNTYKIGQMASAINSLPVLTTNTATGRNISINTTLQAKLKTNKIIGECTQGANPTPSNPQAINVIKGTNGIIQQTITGKNLFDKDNARVLNAYALTTIEANNDNRLITLQLKPNTTYTVSFRQLDSSGNQVLNDDYNYGFTSSLPQLGDTIYNGADGWGGTYNFSFITDSTHIYLALKVCNTTKCDITKTLETLQIEVGSTATTYEPYQEQLVDINIGQNELCSNKNLSIKDDVISGKITKKIGKVDLGTLNWSPVNQLEESKTQGLFCSWGISNIKAFSDMGEAVKNLSNKYVMKGAYPYFYPGRNPDDKTMAQYDVVIYVQNSDFSGYTNEQVKAALSGTILYYELATPQEITIPEFTTPFTYNGATNISNSENANMEIEYYKII